MLATRAYEFCMGVTDISSYMSFRTVSKSRIFPLCTQAAWIRLYILSRVRISELMLYILMATNLMDSCLQILWMLGYLCRMMASIQELLQGWKMRVSNFIRDWSLLSSRTARSITFDIKTKTILAPVTSHQNILQRKLCYPMTWSISSRTTIFVGSFLPIPSIKHRCKVSAAFPPRACFRPPQKRSNKYTYMRLTVLIDMQLRQAVVTVPEFYSKNYSTLVTRDVLPHPVLPCRQSGELLPFYAFVMKPKMCSASFALPGTLSTTLVNLLLSSGDLRVRRSQRGGLGFWRGGGGGRTGGYGCSISMGGKLAASSVFSISSGRSSHSMSTVISQASQKVLQLSIQLFWLLFFQ